MSNAAGTDEVVQTDYITVGEGPQAGFTADVTPGELSVVFANTSQSSESYVWDFGDGATSTDADPTHAYAEDGDYTVTLIATNDCGTDTTTQTVSIVTAPQAGFSADATAGCTPFTVQFTDNSSANTTGWSWSFPGGAPSGSTEANPTVTYDAPGTYTVTLEVSNAAGTDEVVQTDYITVGEAPDAAFTIQTNGATAQFFNESEGGATYQWNFGDGAGSDLANPTHTYENDGEYLVSLTVTNACGSATLTDTVVINSSFPVVAFTADSPTGCAPQAVQFTNQSTGSGLSYEWSFPGGAPATSTEADPMVVYSEPGVYSVTLIAYNANGSAALTRMDYIVITSLPQAGFTYQANAGTVVFSAGAGAGWAYEWLFPDGTTLNSPNPQYHFADNGQFPVQLVVSNHCGADTLVQEVTITGILPSAAFDYGEVSGCAPFSVIFSNQSNAATDSLTWLFPGGEPAFSVEDAPEVTYALPGQYPVTLIAGNAFGADTLVLPDLVSVQEAPDAAIAYTVTDLKVEFQGETAGATTYFWDFGDGTTSNEAAPRHDYAEPGQYNVVLIVTNPCGSDTAEVALLLETSSAGETGWLTGWAVFPNPNEGAFTVTMRGRPRPEIGLRLYNTLGQLIHYDRAPFLTGRAEHPVRLTGLAAGVYWLEVRWGDQRALRRVIIQPF